MAYWKTTEDLNYRHRPSINAAIAGTFKAGEKVDKVSGYTKKVIETNDRTKERVTITWYKVLVKGKAYYASSKYIKQVKTDYREKVAKSAKTVYGLITDLHCEHKSGAVTLNQMKKQKKTTCSDAVSITLQEAGCLGSGKKIWHTTKAGDSKKTTKAKTIGGYTNLKHCKIVKLHKKYKDIPEEYKKAGIVYIYDSNAAVSKGNGEIYSCNNGSSQLRNGKYVKNVMKSGYCFDHKILFAIVPKKE